MAVTDWLTETQAKFYSVMTVNPLNLRLALASPKHLFVMRWEVQDGT